MKASLDLVDGKVLCPHCAENVKVKYIHEGAGRCICSVCLRSIRGSEARRRYENGFKWCSLCATFRQALKERKGSCCNECHTKLRSRSYTRRAKQERELTIKRY